MSAEIDFSEHEPEYEHTEHKLLLRNLQVSDYPDIKRIMEQVYHSAGGALPESKFRSILKTFPEGQICIEDDGKVVAAAFAVVVDYDKFGDKHTYMEITGNIYATTTTRGAMCCTALMCLPTRNTAACGWDAVCMKHARNCVKA